MKTYSYAFGDHTLFLRKEVISSPTLERAIIHGEGRHGLLYVYEDASFAYSMDALVGGKFVMVLDWQALIERLDAAWFNNIRSSSALALLERYIRLVIRCRLKEQK